MNTAGNASFPVELSRATQTLAIRALRSAGEFENLVFSPYAIAHLMLSMVPALDLAGRTQAARALGLVRPVKNPLPFMDLAGDIRRRGDVLFRVANRIWVDQGRSSADLGGKLLASNSTGLAAPLNFRTHPFLVADAVNGWTYDVLACPRGFPGDILAEEGLDPRPRVLATSAATIMGEWANKFYPRLIGKGPFYMNGGMSCHAPIIQTGGLYCSYIGPDSKMLEMPFTGDWRSRISMILWAPRYKTLCEFEKSLTEAYFQETIEKMIDLEQTFFMPPFEIRSRRDWQGLFGTDFRFDPLDGRQGQLLHQAGIALTDFGIAPARSLAPPNTYSGPMIQPLAVFFLDGPFTFWVRECNTGTLLLAGRLAHPE